MKPSILIVDDEEEIQDVLEYYLRSLNVNILKANDGEDALEILRREDIWVLVTDIKMPRMDGITLGEEVRKFDHDLPIIYITAFNDKENMLNALRIGALDFLNKPFDQEIVVHRVKNAIKVRRARMSEQQLIQTLHDCLGIAYDPAVENMDLDKRFEYLNELTTIVSLQLERVNRKKNG
ncbi:MAG: response regulator [Oligoflexia bacterium]|nr:response regulator [Oligoflexia bacterium]